MEERTARPRQEVSALGKAPEAGIHCPAWCVDHRGTPPADEGWTWHHGRVITWRTCRDSDMTIGLGETVGLGDTGPYVEIVGVDGSTVEIDLDDVQTVIDGLRELVGAAQRAAA